MYQRIVVVGNVGKDAEMRYTPSGLPVTSFNVAVNRKWTGSDGQQQEKTTWFRVSCWRKLAETTGQYVKKGMLVLVEGEVEASAYVDKEGGARGSLELTANSVKFLTRAGDGGGMGGGGGEHAEAPGSEEDLPF